MFESLKNLFREEPEEEKTFYIQSPHLGGKLVITRAKDTLHAITRCGITVWDEESWRKAEEDLKDYPPEQLNTGIVDLRPYYENKGQSH